MSRGDIVWRERGGGGEKREKEGEEERGEREDGKEKRECVGERGGRLDIFLKCNMIILQLKLG